MTHNHKFVIQISDEVLTFGKRNMMEANELVAVKENEQQ